WSPQVVPISALQGTGLSEFWEAVRAFRILQADSGRFAARRQSQALAWMWERIDAGLKQSFKTQAAVGTLLPDLSAQVAAGSLAASTAARQLLHAYGTSLGPPITSTEK
ncbi:MAG: methylmalonyl Co-A mutase-associated GTPase MeaB, partial [Betaproteobacteria bacterium]|nr:methylmalonyl Co-A mutase-associated GTPase MeaB [Betaproteobacteria bacterium]